MMLKLQYFGHLMPRTDSLKNTRMLGKIEGRRRGRQRMRWSDGNAPNPSSLRSASLTLPPPPCSRQLTSHKL